MATPDVTADDVVVALDEFDSLGRREFLSKYGFGEARIYFVKRDGKAYDSKAIVGAAHTRRHGVPLRASDFSGGEATVKKILEDLGFVVEDRDATSPPANAVTEESFGAWVMKCNPQVWDPAGFIADGEKVIDYWTVVQNRRSDMIRYGQRVLLWATGPAESPLPRGFWGSGWITGDVQGLVDAAEDPDAVAGAADIDYWLDHEARDRMRFAAPMNLHVWERPITETALLEIPGLDQLEVIRMRQVANPSWVSAEQLALLEPLLPEWPDVGPPADEVITVDPYDAGFGDPLTRAVVEVCAIRAVEEHYRSAGYGVESVERDRCGWDLTCTAPGGRVERVEVKGVSGSRPAILLTRNEYRSAKEDAGWVLAVVTRAVTAPKVAIYSAEAARAAAEPYVYQLDLSRELR
jgi:hypothetical protein